MYEHNSPWQVTACTKYLFWTSHNSWHNFWSVEFLLQMQVGSYKHIRTYACSHAHAHAPAHTHTHTGCPRRNVSDFGRVFLMLKYTDITQNTYVQCWTVTEITAREKCGLLAGPRTVPVCWQSYPCPSLSVVSYDGNSAHASSKLHTYFLQGDNVVHVAAALWMVGRLVVWSC